ncbi:MAG: nucleoside 2-deoxyribosyltransferase [Caulobacter sp.]|nr:nucleoside 2-deoxyribosyltransferase [Caulobacter sp.]
MRRISTLHLAGPDALYPDASQHLARQRLLAAEAGFEILEPTVLGAEVREAGELAARALYAERIARLRRADAGIVNLTPFRGPGADAAASFEMGFLAALGKPVVGWINLGDEMEADYRERVEAWMGARPDEAGVWRDGEDCEIEDFGLPEASLLWAETRQLFVIVTDDPMHDLTGFEMCLEALRLYAD